MSLEALPPKNQSRQEPSSNISQWFSKEEDETSSQMSSGTTSEYITQTRRKLAQVISSVPHYRVWDEDRCQEIQSLSDCITDEEFGIELPFKSVPFFFNHLKGEDILNAVRASTSHLTLKDSKMSAVLVPHVFNNTQSLSGIEELQDRLNKLHEGKLTLQVLDLRRINANSSIKLFFITRLSLRMRKDDYSLFLQAGFVENPGQHQILKARFRNVVSNKSKKELAELTKDHRERRLCFEQLESLMGERERREGREELERGKNVEKLLEGYKPLGDSGLFSKVYIDHPANSDFLELRLGFAFPTASADSFDLELEGLKLL
jgi:hypothetical protein